MDLLDVLEINRNGLPRGTLSAVRFCGSLWDQLGCPNTRELLTAFLDEALKACVEHELRYPKIFLKRLKQLQRNEWQPVTPRLKRGSVVDSSRFKLLQDEEFDQEYSEWDTRD